jgi:hypothetical protein
MGQYVYKGEAEQVLPNTLDGAVVVSPGDTVNVLDGALDGHPLFDPVEADEHEPDPATEPDGAEATDTDAETGEPQEPTA